MGGGFHYLVQGVFNKGFKAAGTCLPLRYEVVIATCVPNSNA